MARSPCVLLLTHTSGLKDYEDLYAAQFPAIDDRKIPQIKDAQILALVKQQSSTDFPPGSQWRYSNTGYALLAMIVENVSGKPFGTFLHQRIFAAPYEIGHGVTKRGTDDGSNPIRVRRRQCWAMAAFIRTSKI